MIETNIRVVNPGSRLYVPVRRVEVAGPHLTPDLLERACGSLRHRHGLAAVRAPGEGVCLLVAATAPVEPVCVEQEEWELELRDSGLPAERLALTDPHGPDLVAPLVERALEARLARSTEMWTLDSPRIWYEPRPFQVDDGVAAYHRYEVSVSYIEGVGVGIALDVGTAFFTEQTLAYYFDDTVSEEERRHRQARFAALAGRQEGQKGTLLYDNGRTRVKCYLESAPEGVTCATTGRIRVKGESYASLLEYYRRNYPRLRVDGAARAIRVSFPGVSRPQYVAADRVWARVMNDDVPDSLGSVDKLEPAARRTLIQAFWSRLGPNPLGRVAPGLRPGFWRPGEDRTLRLAMPTLTFGGDRCLLPPAEPTPEAYRAHYRRRLELLESEGCFRVPPTLERTLYCAYPCRVEAQARRLAEDLAGTVERLCGRTVSVELVGYNSVDGAVRVLRDGVRSGAALFVLDAEPTAYHDVAFGLADWRVKRVTQQMLHKHYRYLTQGVWDRRTRSLSEGRGRARWRDFVLLNALDILQLLDVVPYRADQLGPYEAQLVIDVGHDRRHTAVSLLIARDGASCPDFLIVSDVQHKADHHHEEINPVLLADHVSGVFDGAMRGCSDAIGSLLVIRDGRFYGSETQGIDTALGRLVERGHIGPDARVDFVELHKDTLKSIRVWEVEEGTDAVTNPLEGTAVRLGGSRLVAASTGSATLHQGTAEPYLLTANGRCPSLEDAALATFGSAQLNWSSPRVAQRHALPLKRTDEELTARAAQEIRRLR
ncbi:MAG: hypothetical protein M3P51_00990 [Chloroflexota bacterium]|nr:hypothetical protein [Chloroflexota bacterium]